MSIADIMRRMDRAETELARFRQQVPLRIGSIPSSIVPALFNVLGSDVLTTIFSTQFKGVGTSGTVPTSVPQADPAALTSFAACLGKARLGTRDTGTWVWIATRCNPGSGTVSDTLSSVPNDQAFLSRMTVQMPIAASSDFVTVYLPWDF